MGTLTTEEWKAELELASMQRANAAHQFLSIRHLPSTQKQVTQQQA